MSMTLSVKDKNENTIFNWRPQGKTWWCTEWNPDYQNQKASNITVYGTIDFSQYLNMWKDFYKRYRGSSMWTFDTDNHIAKDKW
jgi:hypothetical protein